ncbi:MAG: ParB/RepB/Spo0J family partition protein [Campylobacterota bacterium]
MNRLGRGLSDILSEVDEAYEKEITSKSSVDDIYELDIANIEANPHQPRKNFDDNALSELSQSIQTHGILQPIIVRKSDDGFLLLAGERRLRAAKLAGHESIKAIITDIEFEKFRELALIENIQREDLNPLEVAQALKSLMSEHSLTHEQLSKRIKKSRTHITNMLRLLSLSLYVREKLNKAEISLGHAKLLINLSEKEQKLAVDTIVGQKLSVRESENLIKQLRSKKSNQKESVKAVTGTEYVDLSAYKQKLEKQIPIDCTVKKKKIEISFKNEAEIETFLQHFKQL